MSPDVTTAVQKLRGGGLRVGCQMSALVKKNKPRPDVEPSTKQGVALIREEVVAGESVFFHSNAE